MSTSRNSTPLYEGIRSFVLSARQSAARGVNLLQVYTNYEIGRRIFEKKSREPTALNMARNSSGIWLPG